MLIALVPVFNEEKNIIGVLNKLEKQMRHIVIVDDGSFDKTKLLVSEWVKNKDDAHFISLKNNRGMSYALRQGFIYVSEKVRAGKFSIDDLVVTIDGDGQHDPDEINRIDEYFRRNNIDVLIGNRDFSNYPRYRVFGNRLISMLASRLGNMKFNDIECGLKVLKMGFIEDLLLYYIGIRYSCACESGIIASLLGYKIDNSYPIRVSYYRKRGPGFLDLLINLLSCVVVALRLRFRRAHCRQKASLR